jgi:hypothetical protein
MGSGGTATPLPTSALDGGEWSASRRGRFFAKKSPLVPTVQESGWAPGRCRRYELETNFLVPVGIRTQAIQPVAHRHTELSLLHDNNGRSTRILVTYAQLISRRTLELEA